MARKVRNVVDRTKRIPRRWAVLLSLIVIVGAGLLFVRTVLAVHDTGAFELDGNATDSVVTPGDDWENIFNNTSTTAVASTFVNDGALNATIFTGGGSKDPQDVSEWAWKDGAGGLPDKDNLLDSFAARYSLTPSASCPSGGAATCEVLYFGSDRFDNSGDAQQGFWFFQSPVSTTFDDDNDPTTPAVDCPITIGGGTGFCDPRTGAPAHHVNGDLLVISDFSNGGTTSTITVFKWNDTVSGNLELLATSDAANCNTAAAGDAFCGLVNPGPGLTTSPWPFLDKSGNGSFLNGEFYEGGINLSLLGLGNECFSSIAAESRSSTSTTATLKDFVIGQFANCTATLHTTPSATSVAPGVSVTDLAVVQGAGTSNPPTPTGNVTFFLCSPAQLTPINTGTCPTGGTQVGSPVALADSSPPAGEASATSAAVNTAASQLTPGRYCFRAEWPGDSNYPAASEDGANECFTVTVITSVTTSAQDWLPNDSGTVTAGPANTVLNGSLSFTLFSGGTCTGSILRAAETFPLAGALSPATRTTTNTATKVSATATVSWLVEFTSTNAGVTSSSHCESTALTITN
jgi:hypothetical protein